MHIDAITIDYYQIQLSGCTFDCASKLYGEQLLKRIYSSAAEFKIEVIDPAADFPFKQQLRLDTTMYPMTYPFPFTILIINAEFDYLSFHALN